MNARQLIQASRVAVQSYGLEALSRRARYDVRRTFGRYLDTPRVAHVDTLERPTAAFAVDLERLAATANREIAIARAERVAEGWYEAYGCEWRKRPSLPADWSVHPVTGTRYPSKSWWLMRPFMSLDPERGDVKDIWEPARFTWVFDLIRGHAVTRDDRFAEVFWDSIESFVAECRPFRGIQWSCGQEIAIRAISCLWAERAFARSPSATERRRSRLADLLAWSGERIDDAVEYALSQRNNHAISEVTGLICLGARLDGVHPDASSWFEHGAALIDELVLDQFAEDGWYIQHSLTYLRLALDQLVVAERVLAAKRGVGLGEQAKARVRSAVNLLAEVVDDTSGDVPNHGANDGAFVLPIAARPYRDFRPSISAAAATFGVKVPGRVLDDEALSWLGQSRASVQADAPAQMPRVVIGSSGWASARTRGARVFVRAGEYESNPSHIDPAHVDLWVGGRSRAVDAGTFRYTAYAPWNNGLAGVGVHNTLDVPSLPAAERGLRFLWLRRPSARVGGAETSDHGIVVDVENDTWADRGILHRRRCLVRDSSVEVIDEVESMRAEPIEIRLQWLVPKGVAQPVVVADPAGQINVMQGDPDSTRGWWSPHYGQRLPAVSMWITLTLDRRATVRSMFS